MGTSLRTAKKLLLGREIEHMISSTGSNQTDAAKIIETSQSRIASLISGAGAISVGDLERLAVKLGFTDPKYLEALLELRRDNHKRGFWTTGYARGWDEDIRLLVDLERHASLLRTVQTEIIPGILQCEPYIRALHEVDDEAVVETSAVPVEDYVTARLARQDILTKDDAPRVYAILSESCLRRVFGGREVMLAQIEHLKTLSHRPNILIQVLPFTTTVRGAGIEDRCVMVRVPSPGAAGDLDLAVVESQSDIRYLDDKRALNARESVWARLAAAALGADDSRAFMDHVARSYKRKTFSPAK